MFFTDPDKNDYFYFDNDGKSMRIKKEVFVRAFNDVQFVSRDRTKRFHQNKYSAKITDHNLVSRVETREFLNEFDWIVGSHLNGVSRILEFKKLNEPTKAKSRLFDRTIRLESTSNNKIGMFLENYAVRDDGELAILKDDRFEIAFVPIYFYVCHIPPPHAVADKLTLSSETIEQIKSQLADKETVINELSNVNSQTDKHKDDESKPERISTKQPTKPAKHKREKNEKLGASPGAKTEPKKSKTNDQKKDQTHVELQIEYPESTLRNLAIYKEMKATAKKNANQYKDPGRERLLLPQYTIEQLRDAYDNSFGADIKKRFTEEAQVPFRERHDHEHIYTVQSITTEQQILLVVDLLQEKLGKARDGGRYSEIFFNILAPHFLVELYKREFKLGDEETAAQLRWQSFPSMYSMPLLSFTDSDDSSDD